MQTDLSDKRLVRRLGRFDATMIVMGGIVGSGIFMNPYVVARQLPTPFLILAVWVLGGLIALIAGFIYAELAARKPDVGGQYAYLRDGVHPLIAFLYGWALLLVIQSGGMAAVALTFARYFRELSGIVAADWLIAVVTLLVLMAINCFGVQAGSAVQSTLMVLKIGVIAALIFCGFFFTGQVPATPSPDLEISFSLFTAIGAAMVPVLFAYGGWQTSGFVAGEMKNPQKDLPVGLIAGVSGVVLLYLGVNLVSLHVLGIQGLRDTTTPASAVMRSIAGEGGARFIAAGIAISTLGFLSQGMLTAPRVYFAMAEDRLFFSKVAAIHPKSRVPVFAIILQGILAILIAVSGKYEQILNYVVSADFLFFGATALALLLIRRHGGHASIRVPGDPVSTVFFIAVSWTIVLNTFFKYPKDSLLGLGFILAGVPVYYFWNHRKSLQGEGNSSRVKGQS